MDNQMKVAIIGGGIAGLSSAYYLNKKAKETGRKISITLLEKEDYWGGKIKTKTEEGFVIEGGPDAYLALKPWMRNLCRELGLGDDLQGTNPTESETFILKNGKLSSIPEGLTMTIPTEFTPLIKTKLMTWTEKARMGFDFILPIKKENTDESLASFISRRIGRAAYDNLVGPLLSGIYAGDGDRLSLQSTFPNLRQMEIDHGGLIKGALALKLQRIKIAKKKTTVKNRANPRSRSIFETHKSGLGIIVEAIVKNLQEARVDLLLNTGVKEVEKIDNIYHLTLEDGTTLKVDKVIFATPAYATGKILKEAEPKLASLLSQIEYVSTATVSLAFRKKEIAPLKGYGYIIPQNEDSKALACTWTSTKWDNRAHEDYVLMRFFVGRIQDANALPNDEQTLINIAKEELRSTMGINLEPSYSWVFRWDKAMPQYNLGHPERLGKIEKEMGTLPNIALAGNGYCGIGMPDCINSGIQAAERILAII
jgi:protoporphyrinogen/coproporphyrinogen III oxidase